MQRFHPRTWTRHRTDLAARAAVQALESRMLLSTAPAGTGSLTPAATGTSPPPPPASLTVSPFAGETGYDPNLVLTRVSTWSRATPASGADLWSSTEPSSAMDMKVVGSAVTLHYEASANGALAYSIDGAASVTPTLTTTGADTALTVSFPTDGTHTLHFDINNAGTFELEPGIQLTGAAPATLQPDHFGAQYALDPAPAYIVEQGGWQTSAAAGDPYVDNMPPGTGIAYPDESLTFHANGSELWAWVQRTGGTLHLSVDGQSDVATPISIPSVPGGTWGWVEVGSGLDTTAEHEYRLSVTATGVYGQPQYGTYLGSLMVVGGQMDSTFSAAGRTNWAFYGDSITMASGFTPFDSSIGFAHKLGLQYDVGVVNRGVSGNSVQIQGATQTATLTGLGIVPSKLFILDGTNDMGPAGDGSTPTAQFKTAFVTMLNDFLSSPGWGATQVYVIGILPRQNFSPATIAAWNGLGNGIQGAIAASQDPGRVTFVDPTDWQFNGPLANDYGTNYTDDGASNGVHPNNTGFNLIVKKLAPVLAPRAATASFVAGDAVTQGNWPGAYGADGYDLFGGAAQLPAYAQLSTTGAQARTWGTSTSDVRDLLDSPTATTRTAAGDYSATSWSMDLNLLDGKTHQVALYLLDWDRQGRGETIQITDAATGAVLDHEAVSSFSNGQWLSWDLSGHVKITITDTAGPDAVVSAVMFDPMVPKPATAAFVRADSATQGNWPGVYGADGYDIIGNATVLPSYARLSAAGQQFYLWSELETKPKDLVEPGGSTTRIAASDYTATSFTLDVNLTDGNAHQVALYFLDWEPAGRKESVRVSDATTGAILDTEQVSNFGGGEYLAWNLSGHVTITITNTAGSGNAVLSGVMFDPVAPPPVSVAKFVTTDTATGGRWTGVYGADGYSVIGGQTNLPAYASLITAGAQTYTWSTASTDARNMQVGSGSSSLVGAADFSATSFTLDLNLTDGKAHQVALYLLDWDRQGRSESVQVRDAATGLLLDSRTISNFGNGEYLTYDLSGHVKITFTNTGPQNAVLSGILFDPVVTAPPSAAASFVGVDTSTAGTWTGAYGGDGYDVLGGASSIPAYAHVAVANAQAWTWATSTTDPRGVQTAPAATARVASCDYSATSFSIDLNLTDGSTHQVAVYLLDWDRLGRSETVQVSNAVTGAVLDTRTASNFGGGEYLAWNLSGHVKITFTNTGTGPQNAVLGGIFFDTAVKQTPATAAFLKNDASTQGTWAGAYGADGFDAFDGPASLPAYARLGVDPNQANYVWATAQADPRALRTSATAATGLAACYFTSTSMTLDLNLTDAKSHRVALYLVDWDKAGRSETVQITDAASGAVLDTQSASSFTGGQWLSWTLSGHVKITISNGGNSMNAVASGLFFG